MRQLSCRGAVAGRSLRVFRMRTRHVPQCHYVCYLQRGDILEQVRGIRVLAMPERHVCGTSRPDTMRGMCCRPDLAHLRLDLLQLLGWDVLSSSRHLRGLCSGDVLDLVRSHRAWWLHPVRGRTVWEPGRGFRMLRVRGWNVWPDYGGERVHCLHPQLELSGGIYTGECMHLQHGLLEERDHRGVSVMPSRPVCNPSRGMHAMRGWRVHVRGGSDGLRPVRSRGVCPQPWPERVHVLPDRDVHATARGHAVHAVRGWLVLRQRHRPLSVPAMPAGQFCGGPWPGDVSGLRCREFHARCRRIRVPPVRGGDVHGVSRSVRLRSVHRRDVLEPRGPGGGV